MSDWPDKRDGDQPIIGPHHSDFTCPQCGEHYDSPPPMPHGAVGCPECGDYVPGGHGDLDR